MDLFFVVLFDFVDYHYIHHVTEAPVESCPDNLIIPS